MGARHVGILTFHCANNYGAVLQAYALQTTLERLGHSAEVIDYRPGYVWYAHRPFRPRSFKDLELNAIRLVKCRRFDAFRAARLKLSRPALATLGALRAAPPACDAYVCGSDQIWNPGWGEGADPAFFLDFGPDAAVRVAYAASFGTPDLAPAQRERIATLLRRLDHVSVREDGAVGLARDLGAPDPQWLPDPSLLLTAADYRAIAAPAAAAEPYVFAYLLEDSPLATAACACASECLRAPCVTAEVYRPLATRAGRAVQHPSPERWLGLVADAAAVVTNSFHGTAFSIINRRPFAVLAWSGGHGWADARALSLLRRLGLEHRFVRDPDAGALRRLLCEPEDWDGVERRLAQWRDEARDFLRSSLA